MKSTAHPTPILEGIRIASPCAANWADMTGDEQKRYCQLCKLNVYNLSNMTREQAEEFVRTAEGHVCVRLHKRADGTVISRDCPVGFRAAARKVVGKVAAGIVLGVSLLLGGASIGCTKPATGSTPGGPAPATDFGTGIGTTTTTPSGTSDTSDTPSGKLEQAPDSLPIPREEVVMGMMCPPDEMPPQLPQTPDGSQHESPPDAPKDSPAHDPGHNR